MNVSTTNIQVSFSEIQEMLKSYHSQLDITDVVSKICESSCHSYSFRVMGEYNSMTAYFWMTDDREYMTLNINTGPGFIWDRYAVNSSMLVDFLLRYGQ